MNDEEITARGKILVQMLANILENWVEANLQRNMRSSPECQNSKFHASRAPSISISDYLFRVLKYASCSPECFVLSLIYIRRLTSSSTLVLSPLNVHRIVITSIVLAAKFFDDQYFNNAYYAKVGGVPCLEMNELEIEFLSLIKYGLHVQPAEYAEYYQYLIEHYVNTVYQIPQNTSLAYQPVFITENPYKPNEVMYVNSLESITMMKNLALGSHENGISSSSRNHSNNGYSSDRSVTTSVQSTCPSTYSCNVPSVNNPYRPINGQSEIVDGGNYNTAVYQEAFQMAQNSYFGNKEVDHHPTQLMQQYQHSQEQLDHHYCSQPWQYNAIDNYNNIRNHGNGTSNLSMSNNVKSRIHGNANAAKKRRKVISQDQSDNLKTPTSVAPVGVHA